MTANPPYVWRRAHAIDFARVRELLRPICHATCMDASMAMFCGVLR